MTPMKRLAAAWVVVLTGGFAAAQPPTLRVYSQPLPPPREVLDRLNLIMAWRVYVPVGERRDGIATVQLDGHDMFVQTRAGLVVRPHAATGVPPWRARAGTPSQTSRLLAINRRAVYVVNSTYLFALDRATGAVQWQFRLPGGVSASPVANDSLLFLPTP